MSKQYNYVIFGSDWDLYKFSYSDLYVLPNVKYIASPGIALGWKYYLYRLHFSRRINTIINLPFKSVWNNLFFRDDFPDTNPLCFIFFWSWYAQNKESQLLESLRNRYKLCKCVLFLQDLVATHKDKFDIEEDKNDFDLILSFDPKDARDYNLVYHPLVFSAFDCYNDKSSRYDVYFLGQAKNRYQEIIGVYERLKDAGLSTDFYIIGMSDEQRQYKYDIHYINSMSYLENLRHACNSRCLLEVMQKGGYGLTQRGVEIVGLNKKLLTNNPIIKGEPFYNPKYISTFDKPDNIDKSFLRDIKKEDFVDYNFKENISPKELLTFISDRL